MPKVLGKNFFENKIPTNRVVKFQREIFLSMIKKSNISVDKFEKLLGWLDADREAASEKYELIRLRLIKIFYARGCHSAEELADETMDRVMGKIDTLFESYEGDPALYYYSVAKKILLEFARKPKTEELSPALAQEEAGNEMGEINCECLDKCLQSLRPEQRKFIMDYYQGEKRAKINERKELEKKMKISNQAMRVRIFRIRKKLQKCVLNCIANNKV